MDITNLTIWDIARLAGFSEPTIAAAQAEENRKDDSSVLQNINEVE